MNILVINGPNLNMLGIRNTSVYGNKTLAQINLMLQNAAGRLRCSLAFFQSNHEGEIIDFLQKKSSRSSSGILINPGALTHYGFSMRDALEDTGLPIVEVHLSDISNREDFRKIDVLDGIARVCITGQKEQSYILGLEALIKEIRV